MEPPERKRAFEVLRFSDQALSGSQPADATQPPMARICRAISTSSFCVFGFEKTALAPEAMALAGAGLSVDVLSAAAGSPRTTCRSRRSKA
jgi:hypothetical protein